MAEYIERKAAIEAAKHAWEKGLEPSQYMEIIPVADVVNVRKGRWESDGLSSLKCSDCGYLDDMKMYHRYCPDCGCFMR